MAEEAWERGFQLDLYKADLSKRDLSGANLSIANLSHANLSGANLNKAVLVEADLTGATLIGCSIYGVSAGNVKLEGAKQGNLVIVKKDEPAITVDDIEVVSNTSSSSEAANIFRFSIRTP